MTINTAKVRDRRSLRFSRLDDILADVGRLSASPTRAARQLVAGADLRAFGRGDAPVDRRAPPDAPFKRRCGCGFRAFHQVPIARQRAASRLQNAGGRPKVAPARRSRRRHRNRQPARQSSGSRGEDRRVSHPIFGSMSRAEWDQMHLRHAEMHLSFIRPELG